MRLQDDLARLADGMELYRMRIQARRLIKGVMMAPKFSNALALAGEIEKLYGAIEDDARKLITETIPAMHAKRKVVMAKGAAKIETAGEAIGQVSAFLDKLDEALGDNGGPTLGDSSQPSEQGQDSPKPVEPALPKAATIAAPAPTPAVPEVAAKPMFPSAIDPNAAA